MFLLSIGFLITAVLLLVSLFKLQRASDWVLAWALTAYASLVLEFQVANLFHQVNNPVLVLILQGILLLTCLGLWLVNRRPALFPRIDSLHFQNLLHDKKNWPIMVLLAALAGALAIYAVLIYVVPPNNNDALSLHLARVLFWKQYGSYFPWETTRIWQLTFPVDAQLTYLWTILFTGSDHYIAYIPCLAGLATALLVYRLALELGFRRRSAVLAGAVWLAYPVVQLHLTSVRHDLISTWLFLTCLYYFIQSARIRPFLFMGISGLALGLVVGTNYSIAAYLPGLALVAILWLVTRKVTARHFVLWACSAALAFMLFSSPIFISNWIHFGSPLGPDASAMTSQAAADEMSLGKFVTINDLRWSYQFLDFSGLPKAVVNIGTQLKAKGMQAIMGLLHLNWEGDLATMDQHTFQWDTVYQLDEDGAWYGLLGWALVFPTSLWVFIRGIQQKSLLQTFPLVFLVTTMITCALIRPGWTPYDGRYFMPLAAISAAFVPLWFEGRKWEFPVQAVISLLCFSSICMVILFNPAKQILGGNAIWNMNRIDRLTRQAYYSKEMYYLVEAVVPQDGVIGIASNGQDYAEYGVFGEHFTRKIYEVTPPGKVADASWLRARGIHYLLIMPSSDYPRDIAAGFRYIDSLGKWVIYSDEATP